jgi:hypothetical protein
MTALVLSPLDDAARDGRFQLVSDGKSFSLARWDGETFVFGSGRPIVIEATHYHRFEGSDA